jgi:transposase
MLYTKSQAAEILFVSPKTLQRLCKRYQMDLLEWDYNHNSHFINALCVDFIKTKILPNKMLDIAILISKSEIAKKNRITVRTLYNYMQKPRIKKLLEKVGYLNNQKNLNKNQCKILNEELCLEI